MGCGASSVASTQPSPYNNPNTGTLAQPAPANPPPPPPPAERCLAPENTKPAPAIARPEQKPRIAPEPIPPPAPASQPSPPAAAEVAPPPTQSDQNVTSSGHEGGEHGHGRGGRGRGGGRGLGRGQFRRRGKGDAGREDRPVKSKYSNLGPSSALLGVDVKETPMFKEDAGSQLYQYVRGNRWHFYNDGSAVDMLVEYVFGASSKITPLGTTQMDEVPDGIRCRLVIHPGETEPFIEGSVNGYSCSIATKEVSAEYLVQKRAENQAIVDDAVAAVRALAGSTKDPEDVLFRCLEKGVPFVDLWFIPGDEANFRSGIDEPIRPTMWQRPVDYLPKEWTNFISVFNDIDPNDIDQGSLGDCYFLCSLAAVAEYPDLVKSVFNHPRGDGRAMQERKAGVYRVTLNKGGWWMTYLLDSYFPTMNNVPCYARNREDPAELWVQLLEKAQAKAHGSYSAIAGGDPLQAMADLCGFPTKRLDEAIEAGDDALFGKLCKWTTAGCLVALSTPSPSTLADGEAARFEAAGLPLGHAYTVLHAIAADGFHLVRIRNPWGNDVEWSGTWGDKDSSWSQHPSVALACGFKGPANDGSFWMEWSDVLQHFTTGGVCYVMPSWHDYRIRCFAQKGVPNMAIEVNVTKRIEVFITLHQKDRRGVEAGSPDAEYASFLIAVSRNEGDHQCVHLHTSLDCEEPSPNPNFVSGRDIAMRYVFEPACSPYVIVPRIYEDTIAKEFVVGILADTAVGEGMEVSFINLTASCPVYQNYLEYDLKDDLERQTAHYQYRHGSGAAVSKSGEEIQISS